MNPELEKLIDYAIMDGYITEAEKKVLFNKAKKMGVDEGELELILNGKLSEKKTNAGSYTTSGEKMSQLWRYNERFKPCMPLM